MSERLKVRLAYQRGWQVVDGSTIVDTFETKEDAFRYMVPRRLRVSDLAAHRAFLSETVRGEHVKTPCYAFSKATLRYAYNQGGTERQQTGPNAGKAGLVGQAMVQSGTATSEFQDRCLTARPNRVCCRPLRLQGLIGCECS